MKKIIGMRPAWLEIDLDKLETNFDAVRRQAPAAKILAAVKANAYGTGLIDVSRMLADKTDYFGVAFLQEGIALRQAGITKPILIFGPGFPDEAAAIVQWNLEQTITSFAMAEALAAAGGAAGRSVNVHLKVDTGMGRLGFLPDEVPEFIVRLQQLRGIRLQGVYSHFATNLNNFHAETRQQLQKFQALLNELAMRRISIPLRHMASSATTLQMPEAHFDMVRPGGCLYGLTGGQPVMTLKARVAHVRELPPDTFIGYRRTYRTRGAERMAVLPLGFSDGLPRALSNRGHALIRGQKFPIVGIVCMDQTVVNVGQADIQIGDEAVLIGKQGGEELTFQNLVELIEGTSPSELASRLSQRLSRVYLRQGRLAHVNYGYLPAAVCTAK